MAKGALEGPVAHAVSRERALVALGTLLRAEGYRFVTPTPETHRRVLARSSRTTDPLRDALGFSRAFGRDAVPPRVIDLLAAAGALIASADGRLRSAVRYSTLGDHLFVHSAYPTLAPNAVFFGPDTYRFCAAIERLGLRPKRCVDVGCGSGAGGIVAGARGGRIVLGDVNEEALVFARVNAELAGLHDVELLHSDVLASVRGPIDLVVSNPPYLVDAARRAYRDGGGLLGEALSLRIARQALERLDPGGTLVLYTGAAIVDGDDPLRGALTPILESARATYRYEEVDPDVFGEELDTEAYAAVERIAVVVLVATRPSS